MRLLDEAGQAAAEILGLRFDNLDRDTKHVAEVNLDDWLYEFQWRLTERPSGQPAPEPSVPASRGNWLIFADSGGVGAALGALINAQGERTILVTRGESYECTDGEHFRIRPERPADLRQVFGAVLAPDQPICRGVVHLWSLDAGLTGETTVASLQTAQTLGCGSVLQLVQEARSGRTASAFPALWLLTRGAQPAGEEILPLDTAQSPLWGLGRVIAQEHPVFWGGLIDLEPSASLLEDVASSAVERNLCSRRRGSDCVSTRPAIRRPFGTQCSICHASNVPCSWRTDGSYLITGGLGDLGLSVARWMVEQGARRLILLGRTTLPPRTCWNSAEAGSRLAHQVARDSGDGSLGSLRPSGLGGCGG